MRRKMKLMASATEMEELQQLGYNAVLPTPRDEATRTLFEGCGVVFGSTVPGLAAFSYATLPEGWEQRPTGGEHDRLLFDEQGRSRARIEIRTNIRYERRYEVCVHPYTEEGHVAYKACDRDGERIFTTPAYSYQGHLDGPDGRAKQKLAKAEAEAWLNEHRPNWRDPILSWDY